MNDDSLTTHENPTPSSPEGAASNKSIKKEPVPTSLALPPQRDIAIRDVVGAHGVPAAEAGFGIRIRKGLKFDGTGQYVDCGNEAALSFATLQQFTFEAWVQPATKGPRGGVLVSKLRQNADDSKWEGEYLLGIEPDGRVSFKWKGSLGSEAEEPDSEETVTPTDLDGTIEILRTDRALPFEEFSHIAVTYDGYQLKIYLRGDEAAAVNTFMGPVSEVPVVIGAFMKGTTPEEGFNGILDELRIWNVCRSDVVLRRERSRVLDTNAEGLVSCWRFKEGSGDRTKAIGSYLCEGVLGKGEDTDNDSFQPTWTTPEIWITRGRCYVEGLLCENEQEVRFTEQPDAPGLTLPRTEGLYKVYLDVWEPTKASPMPTMAHAQTVVAQVKMLLEAEAQRQRRAFKHKGQLTAWRQAGQETISEDHHYRVEIHHSGGLYGTPLIKAIEPTWEVSRVVSVDPEKKQLTLTSWKGHSGEWEAGQYFEIFQVGSLAEEPGILGRATAVDHAARTIEMEALVGEWGPSDGPWSLRRIASFKWMRNKTAGISGLSFEVKAVEATDIVLKPYNDSEALPQVGDWVEPCNTLMPIRSGLPLCRVTATAVQADGSIRVSLDGLTAYSGIISNDVPALEKKPLFLKCWRESRESNLPAQGLIPLQKGTRLLEEGIYISFEGDGSYLKGDYWELGVNAATQDIEWPRQDSGPLPQPPKGIIHHYAPLARLWFKEGTGFEVSEDLRKVFVPLTAPALSQKTPPPPPPTATPPQPEKPESEPEPLPPAESPTPPTAATPPIPAPLPVAFPQDSHSVTLSLQMEPPAGYHYTGASLMGQYQEASWESTPALPEGGKVSVATLLGQLYVLTESGRLWLHNPAIATDPAASPWIAKGFLPTPRTDYGICVLEDELYVIGGYETSSGQRTGLNEVYNPQTDTWSSKTPMLKARSELGVAAAGGKVFAIGGNCNGCFSLCKKVPTTLVEAYDPQTDSWSKRKAMPEAKSGFTAVTLHDQIYCIGGRSKSALGLISAQPSASNLVYSATTGTWRIEPGLERARSGMGLAVIEQRLYLAGGNTEHGAVSQVEVYDPHLRLWYTEEPLHVPRYGLGLAVHDGKAYAIGGIANDQNLTTVETLQLLRPLYVHCRDEKGS